MVCSVTARSSSTTAATASVALSAAMMPMQQFASAQAVSSSSSSFSKTTKSVSSRIQPVYIPQTEPVAQLPAGQIQIGQLNIPGLQAQIESQVKSQIEGQLQSQMQGQLTAELQRQLESQVQGQVPLQLQAQSVVGVLKGNEGYYQVDKFARPQYSSMVVQGGNVDVPQQNGQIGVNVKSVLRATYSETTTPAQDIQAEDTQTEKVPASADTLIDAAEVEGESSSIYAASAADEWMIQPSIDSADGTTEIIETEVVEGDTIDTESKHTEDAVIGATSESVMRSTYPDGVVERCVGADGVPTLAISRSSGVSHETLRVSGATAVGQVEAMLAGGASLGEVLATRPQMTMAPTMEAFWTRARQFFTTW